MTTLPRFYKTFIPILQVLHDGKIIHYNDLRKLVRDTYYNDLPADQLARTTQDGTSLIINRIGWAKSYLKQAGYINYPVRAMVQITDKGKTALKRGSLSFQELKSQPEFISVHKDKASRSTSSNISTEEQTPQDMIESGMQAIEEEVKSEILEKLKTLDPFYFEKIVNELFEKMGYGGAQTTVKTGDGGIDGIINKDELGLEKIYVQAKRYSDHNVREPEIRNFIGMSGDTQKGIFVTTSAFDAKAVAKAANAMHKIILVDGEQLADLMYRFGVGVHVKNTYEVKSVNEEYFL